MRFNVPSYDPGKPLQMLKTHSINSTIDIGIYLYTCISGMKSSPVRLWSETTGQGSVPRESIVEGLAAPGQSDARSGL